MKFLKECFKFVLSSLSTFLIYGLITAENAGFHLENSDSC